MKRLEVNEINYMMIVQYFMNSEKKIIYHNYKYGIRENFLNVSALVIEVLMR